MHPVLNNSNLLCLTRVWLCYATLWHEHMRENGSKLMHKLSQHYLSAIIIWHLSKKCYFKHAMIDAGVWLRRYAYIFAILTYLTTGNQCLTIFSFQKLWVIGNIFIRRSEKTHKINKKVDMSKMPMINRLFKQVIIYT